MNKRNLIVAASGYETRTEMFEGREHLVVPVVALVEGVIHAMNASGPELVTAEVFSRAVAGWNGRPIFEGHPMLNGRPVSGNLPDVLPQRVGLVFNAKLKNNKLAMEAWLDVERCKEVAPALLERAQEKGDIEISVGAFVETDDSKGTHGGKRYAGAWTEIIPDHLALLPDGDEGACSRKAGCGVRAARGNGNNQYVHDNATKTQNGDATITRLSDGEYRVVHTDKDGQTTTTVHSTQAEALMHKTKVVRAAVGNGNNQYTHDNATKDATYSGKHGEFKVGNPDGEVWHITNKDGETVAYAKSEKQAITRAKYFAEHGKDPRDAKGGNVIKNGLLARVMEMFRAAQPSDEMSSNDLSTKLTKALQEAGEQSCYVEAFYPVTNPTQVVYSCYASPDYYLTSKRYERAFTLEENGAVKLADEKIEVEPVVYYEPVAATVAEPKAASGASSAAETRPEPIITSEEITMKLEDVQKFLETASDCDMKTLSASIEARKPAVVPAKVEAPVVAEVKTLEAKTPTFDEVYASAPADIRAAIDSAKATAAATRAVSIKALKATNRCPYGDEELAKMTQGELDKLATLAGSPRAAVDFSAQGAPVATEVKEVSAAPDLAAAIRSARGVK